jgi:ribosomal protein S18 acetylase RimI-like enzyme
MDIIKASIKDVRALLSFASLVYRATFGPEGYLPDEFLWSESELQEQLLEHKSPQAFETAIKNDSDDFLIALDNETQNIIGYIGLRKAQIDVNEERVPTERDQATNGICIHPEFHRKGVGKSLLEAAFSEERFQKAENIYAIVWDKNIPSYSFFY